MEHLSQSPLGKKVGYKDQYDRDLLVPIDRARHRQAWGGTFPFYGHDVWVGYELSWLNAKGKPEVALLQVVVPAGSPFLIESKSFKLYLNSFNQTVFSSQTEVEAILARDLSDASGSTVSVRVAKAPPSSIITWSGALIDDLDVACTEYHPNPVLLAHASNEVVEESLVSHLLKSNCLVTGQPDWGSVRIDYKGPALDRASLLQYLVSYRNHQGFHEDCVEQIFMDLYNLGGFDVLTVEAFYTRRGGLDIRPMRTTSSEAVDVAWSRLLRQ